MTPSRPRPPSSLGRAGAALWRKLTAPPAPGEVLLFSQAELALLTQACKVADDIAALERVLKRDGLIVPGSKGQPRLSGCVAELRLQRGALARLVAALAVPDDGEASESTPAQRRARHAAMARWDKTPRLSRSKYAAHG